MTKIDVTPGIDISALNWSAPPWGHYWISQLMPKALQPGWSELESLFKLCELWEWFSLKFPILYVCLSCGVGVELHLMHVQYNIQQTLSAHLWGSFSTYLLFRTLPYNSSCLSLPKCQLSLNLVRMPGSFWVLAPCPWISEIAFRHKAKAIGEHTSFVSISQESQSGAFSVQSLLTVVSYSFLIVYGESSSCKHSIPAWQHGQEVKSQMQFIETTTTTTTTKNIKESKLSNLIELCQTSKYKLIFQYQTNITLTEYVSKF